MNKLFETRMEALRHILIAGYSGGKGMSSATIGQERELFLNTLLRTTLPVTTRIASGDIIDSFNGQSGQVDAIVEFPHMPSLPLIKDGPRLVFAEGVACTIEVKSNLANQWNEVVETAAKVKALRRKFGTWMSSHGVPRETIPVVAVGYTGWSTMKTVVEKIEQDIVDAIYIVDAGLCATRFWQSTGPQIGQGRLHTVTQEGPSSTGLLLLHVHHTLSSLMAASMEFSAYI